MKMRPCSAYPFTYRTKSDENGLVTPRAAVICVLVCACGRIGFDNKAGDSASCLVPTDCQSGNCTDGLCATPWWRSSWQYRRRITLDNSASPEVLTDFPLLLSFATSELDYSKTMDRGEDIRFVDADGTSELAHEIQRWVETGTSIVWVEVPQIDASSTTDYIWMYYGNPMALDGQQPAEVWSNAYAGVWHLGEDPAATAPQIVDSTANANQGTSNGTMTSADQVVGVINGCLEFDGENDFISIAHDVSLDVTAATTISAWVRSDTTSTNEDFMAKTDFDVMRMILRERGVNNLKVVYTIGGNEIVTLSDDNILEVGVWLHLTYRYDGSETQVFVDGQPSGPPVAASGSLEITGNDLRIGYWGSGTDQRYFRGRVDEVRISNEARSDHWIAAQHKSMRLGFATLGAEQTP